MENAPDEFLTALRKSLAARAAWLEESVVPALADGLCTFRSLLGSAIDTLVKKGLLSEDRYDYDARGTELEMPPDTPIPEGSEAAEIGFRLAAYGRQIDLFVNSSPFSLKTLKSAQVKKISSALAYIDWPGFGEGAPSPTTRSFAQAVAKVRLSPDALSARVVRDSIVQIQRLAADIGRNLADVAAWQREAWKAEVREKILPAFVAGAARRNGERTGELEAFKKVFDSLPGGSWDEELAQQILDEEYSKDSTARKERVLSSLGVPKPLPAAPEASVDHRQELLIAIRDLCHVARELSVADGVLVENEHSLETRTLGVFGRLRRFFQRMMGKFPDRFYDIALNPRGTSKSEPRSESIDFLQFVADLRELQGILDELGNAQSGEGRRIQGMSEVDLCGLLEWQVRQVRHAHRRMEGLNAFFQLRAVEDVGGTARSIKLELLRIENSIARADKVRGECAVGSPGGALPT